MKSWTNRFEIIMRMGIEKMGLVNLDNETLGLIASVAALAIAFSTIIIQSPTKEKIRHGTKRSVKYLLMVCMHISSQCKYINSTSDSTTTPYIILQLCVVPAIVFIITVVSPANQINGDPTSIVEDTRSGGDRGFEADIHNTHSTASDHHEERSIDNNPLTESYFLDGQIHVLLLSFY